MNETLQPAAFPAGAARPFGRLPVMAGWVWLTVASSFLVFLEPAPCDVLGAGLLVVALAAGQRIPAHLRLPAWLLGLFALGNLVASALAPDPSASLLPFGIRVYLVLGWWLLLASLLADRPEALWRTIMGGWLFAATITALAGTLAFFGLLPDDGQLVDGGRVRAFFKDPNVYGPFLVPPMIACLAQLESCRPAAMPWHAVLFGLLGLGLVLGFSRGSWLNLTLSLCLFLALRLKSPRPAWQRRRMKQGALVFVLVGIAVFAAALNSEPVRDMLEVRARVTQDYDVNSSVGGTKSRFDVQAETLRLAASRPLGIGAGQSEMDYFQGKAPHNLFLHTLVEGGWLGGFAFWGFLALTLYRAQRVLFAAHPLQAGYQAVFACLVGLLSQSLFVDSTHWRHFYLLLALLWGPLQFLERQVAVRRR